MWRAVLRLLGIRRAADAVPAALPPDPCLKPPPGWRCTRERGHRGPCAAVEQTEREVTIATGRREVSVLLDSLQPPTPPGGTLVIKAAPPRPPRKGK